MAEETYAWASWLFLRLLGVVHLIAFTSLAVQIRGLVGARGILPARELADDARGRRLRAYVELPTLAQVFASDRALLVQCVIGVTSSLALIAGFVPIPALLAAWLLYLSLTNACGLFLGYQWDALLSEMALLAVLLAPPVIAPELPGRYIPPEPARLLLVWLLFRLVFSSGVVKLRSGDPTWRNLTALCYHYETQPLPNPIAWWMHQLPRWFHRLSAAVMFAIELVAPFLLFLPAPWSYVGAGSIALLMFLIQATGNFGFFNLQTVILCVLVIGDHAMPLAVPASAERWGAGPAWRAVVTAGAGLFFALSLLPTLRLFWRFPLRSHALISIMRLVNVFRLANPYGLFAVMTTSRPEIMIEGSDDGATWKAYELRYKPGDPLRRPPLVAPHQPRLDWQLWFAALGTLATAPWVIALLTRILEGSPEALGLFANNPFPERPPRYARAMLYDYRFTSRAERRATGAWWRRERIGVYCPAFSLRTPAA